MKKLFNLGRKLLACALLVALVGVSIPASAVMAAEATPTASPVAVLPAELDTSYLQLASTENTVMPRTSYFIPDQEFSFRGTFSTYNFNVPSACQARLVIAAIGNEPLYIDVMKSTGQCERSLVIAPNEAQVQVFNISSGAHYLKFSSITGSQFTVRMQMYTWDY